MTEFVGLTEKADTEGTPLGHSLDYFPPLILRNDMICLDILVGRSLTSRPKGPLNFFDRPIEKQNTVSTQCLDV